MNVTCEINGTERSLDVSKSALLLDVLREHGYSGAKRGCDTGACGMCTVQVDGEPTMSCVTPAARIDGATVETIEGLGSQTDLHPIQEAFLDNSALQCGFCIPGMIMRTKALLEENPEPTEAEVREALSDNLCRCTGYKKIVEAVLDASERLSASDVAADGGRPSGGAANAVDSNGSASETGGEPSR